MRFRVTQYIDLPNVGSELEGIETLAQWHPNAEVKFAPVDERRCRECGRVVAGVNTECDNCISLKRWMLAAIIVASIIVVALYMYLP